MRTRLIFLGVLFTVALAACGSSKSDSASKSNPTADMEKAKKVVLVTSDFPPGWTATPDDQTESADDKARSKELSDCVGTSGDETQTAKWSGDSFSMNDDEVSSESNVASDNAVYRKDIAAIKSPKLRDCVKTIFTKLLTEQIGQEPTAVEVAPLEVAKHGDTTVGVRMKVSLATEATDTLYVDLVLMGKKRVEVTTTFTTVGKPIDAALEKSLIDKQGARLNAV